MSSEFIARNGIIAQNDSEITGSLAINDSGGNLNIVGNAFGQVYLQSTLGALVLNPGYGGVNINGANPSLKVDGNITTDGYVISNAAGSRLTGSLYGTASWAQNSTTSSYSVSASYAVTSSYALSSSYSLSGSFALNVDGGSF